jgi:hypothetical protein
MQVFAVCKVSGAETEDLVLFRNRMHYRGNELKKTAGKALKRYCETQEKSKAQGYSVGKAPRVIKMEKKLGYRQFQRCIIIFEHNHQTH